jgi:hypothetical protein
LLVASSQELAASFVKDRPSHCFFALERISNFTICSLISQAKNQPKVNKNAAVNSKLSVETGWSRPSGLRSWFRKKSFLAPQAAAQRSRAARKDQRSGAR